MERDRIDPTIFERSFPRTLGLARLLVLEALPKTSDREEYLIQRRSERGRPALPTKYYQRSSGNMKDYAILTGDEDFVNKLLELGAKPQISFEDFVPSFNVLLGDNHAFEDRHHYFVKSVNQSIIEAVQCGMPIAAEYLLHNGADANTLTIECGMVLMLGYEMRYPRGTTLLDVVNEKIENLEKAITTESPWARPMKLLDDFYYLGNTAPGTYQHWQLSKELITAKRIVDGWHQARHDKMKNQGEQQCVPEKIKELVSLKHSFESLRREIIKRGGKTVEDLHPNIFVPLPEQQDEYKR